MTKVPEKCNPYFDAIWEGRGREVGDLEGLIDCLSKKISDNMGQKRAGKRSHRKAVEIVGKLKTGEIKKFNPDLAFTGKSDPFDMTNEEHDKLQEDMLRLNWELLDREEKDIMKTENGMPDLKDDELFEMIRRDEMGIEDESDGTEE